MSITNYIGKGHRTVNSGRTERMILEETTPAYADRAKKTKDYGLLGTLENPIGGKGIRGYFTRRKIKKEMKKAKKEGRSYELTIGENPQGRPIRIIFDYNNPETLTETIEDHQMNLGVTYNPKTGELRSIKTRYRALSPAERAERTNDNMTPGVMNLERRISDGEIVRIPSWKSPERTINGHRTVDIFPDRAKYLESIYDKDNGNERIIKAGKRIGELRTNGNVKALEEKATEATKIYESAKKLLEEGKRVKKKKKLLNGEIVEVEAVMTVNHGKKKLTYYEVSKLEELSTEAKNKAEELLNRIVIVKENIAENNKIKKSYLGEVAGVIGQIYEKRENYEEREWKERFKSAPAGSKRKIINTRQSALEKEKALKLAEDYSNHSKSREALAEIRMAMTGMSAEEAGTEAHNKYKEAIIRDIEADRDKKLRGAALRSYNNKTRRMFEEAETLREEKFKKRTLRGIIGEVAGQILGIGRKSEETERINRINTEHERIVRKLMKARERNYDNESIETSDDETMIKAEEIANNYRNGNLRVTYTTPKSNGGLDSRDGIDRERIKTQREKIKRILREKIHRDNGKGTNGHQENNDLAGMELVFGASDEEIDAINDSRKKNEWIDST